MKTIPGLCLILCLTGSISATASDWPQWRGPDRTGISLERGLLKEWPKGGPRLLWKLTNVGSGYATPSVVGDRIFLLSNEGMENESVLALSSKDGTRLWSRRLGKVGNPKQEPNYPGARSTPTVEGKLLYALGSDGDLACLETAGGKVRWKKSLRSDFGGKPSNQAYAESPLIDGDKLICTPGGTNATMIALNKQNGAVIWKCAITNVGGAAYASPIVTEAGGIKQYVQLLPKMVIGVDAKAGKLLWHYERTIKGTPAAIPTPVADKDLIYTASKGVGGGVVRIHAENGTAQAEEVYFSPKMPTAIGGAVKVGDFLYGTTPQALLCVDFASGTVKWSERSVGAAAICLADGLLYLHGENGDAALVEASPDGYHEKGRFTPPDQPEHDDAKAWAYPVVANGRLYLRDGAVLWCYAVKE